MKKIFTVAMAIALVAAFTVPAMAETQFSFKGSYRVRGFMLSNSSMQAGMMTPIDNNPPNNALAAKATGKVGTKTATAAIPLTGEGVSDSYMDMRFRMESTFKVSDNLSVVTRFDALDGKLFGNTDNYATDIDFDRAYMVITTDIGKFQAGRMSGGMYGNSFRDSEGERDRLRYDTKLGDVVISAIFEKQAENDGGSINTDTDNDWYYLAGTYMTEDITGGLLLGYNQDKRFSENAAYNPTAGAASINTNNLLNIAAWQPGYDRSTFLLDPFVNANFGDLNVKAEMQMLFGKFMEFDRDGYIKGMKSWDLQRKKYVNGAGVVASKGAQPDIDFDAFAWNLEGTYATGPFAFQLGYTWAKGENNPLDDKWESTSGVGADWGEPGTKPWILTSTDSGFETTLGGNPGAAAAGAVAGNLGQGDPTNTSTAALNGCKMIYLSGSFSPMENLTVTALYANSKAEAPGYVGMSTNPLLSTRPQDSRSFATDHGSEYDLTVDWDIFDNLNYQFIAGYLDAGDYWQFGNPYRELENTWTLWNQIQLSF